LQSQVLVSPTNAAHSQYQLGALIQLLPHCDWIFNLCYYLFSFRCSQS